MQNFYFPHFFYKKIFSDKKILRPKIYLTPKFLLWKKILGRKKFCEKILIKKKLGRVTPGAGIYAPPPLENSRVNIVLNSCQLS